MAGKKRSRDVSLPSILCLLFALAPPTGCQSLRKLGQISAPHAAFAALVDKHSVTKRSAQYSLVVSAFNPIPFTHDTIFEVPDVGQHLQDLASAHVQEVTRSVTWPNEVTQVPDDVFNKSGLVVAAGGFLVPFKDHGSVTLFDLDVMPPLRHSVTSSGGSDASWFYHRVLWRDMDGDGIKDAVTCRAKTHIFGSTEGQLVWFKHPKANALTSSWTAHVIDSHGPDTFFVMTSLPTPEGDVECVITAGYFSNTLNVYWTTDPQGSWFDTSKVQKRVIDSSIGHVFDVSVTDVNGDGVRDLLVTNNAVRNASVFAYTVPSDFRTGSFTRRQLAGGFASRATLGPGHGAPGTAQLAFPTTSQSASQKPLVLVSGDDDSQAHLLRPDSAQASDWSYTSEPFLDAGSGVVGGMAVGDVDGDGYNEVFVPDFNHGLVHVFTFKP